MSSNPTKKPSIWMILLLSPVMVLSLRNMWTFSMNSASYKREESPMLQQDNKKQNKTRVAVVVTTRSLDNNECIESRLRHWVETGRNNNAATATSLFDIWVSYKRPSETINANSSSSSISSSIHGLNHHFQHGERLSIFDDRASGSSKSSFLRFAQEHSQEYEYVWHVEDDVFYTGQWQDFLEDENLLRDGDDPQNTILTSLYSPNKKKRNWPFVGSCSWNGTKCKSFGHVDQVGWMMIRFPMKLAVKLWQDLSSKQLQAHHEAAIGTFCALHKDSDDCQIRTIPADRIGRMVTGHTRRNDPSPPMPKWERDKIYHPIKCSAFPEPGSLAKLQNNFIIS